MSAFGARLRQFRLRAGLSQEALATRAGVTSHAISAIERGRRRRPYPETLRRLTSALALDPVEHGALVATIPAPDHAASADPTAPPAAPAARLPIPRTSLVGRERECEALCAMLLDGDAPLVTITGVGGGGKTRLALAVATALAPSLAEGVFWVELAPVTDAAAVPQTVASALGVVESPGTSLATALAGRLAGRPPLLVLDNCEHLIDASAQLVESLLAACPRLRVLATSREPLRIAGEQQWRLAPLPPPADPDKATPADLERSPAVRLFLDRARAVLPAFRFDAHSAPAVAEICARLEGIPLALELAAARVRVLTPAQILLRLDDSFRLLTGGSRAAPTRQQTLRAALDWSDDLLDEPERALFHALAVFAGGFDLAAAEALTGNRAQGTGNRHGKLHASPVPCSLFPVPSLDTLELLTRLVDKSLVVVEADGADARYRLLEPVRQYALGRLRAAGREDEARAAHAAHYLAVVADAAAELVSADQVAYFDRLRADTGNPRAALAWWQARGETRTVARMALALAPFWEVRGLMSEGRCWLEPALASTAPDPLDAQLRVRTLIGAGRLAYWQIDLAHAAALLESARALAAEHDDQPALADALSWLGAVRRRQGDYAEAGGLLTAGLTLHERGGDPAGAALARFMLGMLVGNQGDWRRAVAILRESLDQFRDLGDRRFIGIAGALYAAACLECGAAVDLGAVMGEAIPHLRAVRDRAFLLTGLTTLAMVAAHTGAPARAVRLLGAAETLQAALRTTLAAMHQSTIEEVLTLARRSLGAAELAAALAAGRALSLDEALAEASLLASPAPSQPTLPARGEQLTRREREVAALLARGMSDREIAAELSLAVSTVGVHVHRILGKLGLNSRWQVTSDAYRVSSIE